MTMLERIARKLARWRARRGESLAPDDVTRLGHHAEFDLVFVDDARQPKPTRAEMRPLVAAGAVSVPANVCTRLSAELDAVCRASGFPAGEEFKWSPHRNQWMYSGLSGEARRSFFLSVLATLAKYEARAAIVVVDEQAGSATGASSPEEDATRLLIERIEHMAVEHDAHCLVIADRPGGGRPEEDAFLLRCLELLQNGTAYVTPERVAHNVVSTPSHLSRLLQCADLVTSVTLARVAGEREYSPPIFEAVRPLLYHDGNRIGGYGLKIHPAFRYLNLYYWLLGDSHFWRLQTGIPLPVASDLYVTDEWTPRPHAAS